MHVKEDDAEQIVSTGLKLIRIIGCAFRHDEEVEQPNPAVQADVAFKWIDFVEQQDRDVREKSWLLANLFRLFMFVFCC